MIDSPTPLVSIEEETRSEPSAISAPATGSGGAEKPITIIRPSTGWVAVNLAQLWSYRELLYFLVWRDVKVRYKQTVLGAAWAILQPAMTMVVFTVFFGRLGGMADRLPADLPYSVFVYASLLAWTLFSAIVSQASLSMVLSGNMISKIYFPRLLVPLSTAGTALVDFVLSLGLMAVLMAVNSVLPTWNLLLLPLFVAGTVMAAIGVGTLSCALVVAYRDFRYVVPFVVQLWMFASPVPYPLSVIPPEWRPLYSVNPVVGMISGFSSCLLGQPFEWGCIGISFVSTLIVLAVGLFYFRQVERRFADII